MKWNNRIQQEMIKLYPGPDREDIPLYLLDIVQKRTNDIRAQFNAGISRHLTRAPVEIALFNNIKDKLNGKGYDVGYLYLDGNMVGQISNPQGLMSYVCHLFKGIKINISLVGGFGGCTVRATKSEDWNPDKLIPASQAEVEEVLREITRADFRFTRN